MGKYAARGTGLNDAATRKKLYTAIIVLAGAIIAVLVTLGIITRDQVTDFIAVLGWAVGIAGGVIGIVSAALARANVEPPEGDRRVASDE